MIKIDLFLMNPPYNSGDGGNHIKNAVRGVNTKHCSNIMKSLEKHRAKMAESARKRWAMRNGGKECWDGF